MLFTVSCFHEILCYSKEFSEENEAETPKVKEKMMAMRGVQLMGANANGSSVVRGLCIVWSVLNALELLQVLGKTFVVHGSVMFKSS